MKDAEYRAFVQAARKSYRRWRPLLGLEAWDITLEFYDDRYEDYESAARTTVRWEYASATVQFYVPACLGHDIDELVVHELCHVIVNEMRDDSSGALIHDTVMHEERVCTMLTRALLRAERR